MKSPKSVTTNEFLEILSRRYAVGEIWFYLGLLLGTQNSLATGPTPLTHPQNTTPLLIPAVPPTQSNAWLDALLAE